MKPASFDYVRVFSVPEAVEALSGVDAKIIAGGQSLVPMMNFRLVQPERLVDINAISSLSCIEETDSHLSFGALVRHAEALRSELVLRHLPVVPEAMRHVAHLAIRNRGTIAGSLVHADPAAEWPLLVILLDGEIEITGQGRTRRTGAGDFFIAPLVTSTEEDEIVTSVHFRKPDIGTGMAFEEVAQRAGDFAIISAGAVLRIDAGNISEAKLALGGVGNVVVRAAESEACLLGKPPSEGLITEAAGIATKGLEPMSDLHASSEYRLHLVPSIARRVLARAAARAAGFRS